MADRPPFDLIRAAFYLLAAVIMVVMVETLVVLLGCSWLIVVLQKDPIGSCAEVGTQIREVISEMVTAILALLVATRGPPPEDKE